MHNKHKKMMSQYTCNSNKLHTSYIVDDVCHDDIIPIDKSGNRHILQVSLSTASALSILATTTIPSLQMLDLLLRIIVFPLVCCVTVQVHLLHFLCVVCPVRALLKLV